MLSEANTIPHISVTQEQKNPASQDVEKNSSNKYATSHMLLKIKVSKKKVLFSNQNNQLKGMY